MAETKHTPLPWHDGANGYSITGPTSPTCSGVTVQEAVAHRKWCEEFDQARSKGVPFEQLPKSPSNISVPITVGEKTVAIATGNNREEAEANSALIVKCCNAYPALVEALRALLQPLRSDWQDMTDEEKRYANRLADEREMREFIESALRAAGEEL